MSRIARRVALVTGGGRGLGRAMAVALLEAGHDVVLAATDLVAMDAVIAETQAAPGRAKAIVADLAKPGEAERLAADAVTAFGRIDMLVNNAGISMNAVSTDYLVNPYRFWQSDRAIIDRFLQINAIAPMVLAAILAPPMMARGWGRIVANTTSLDSMTRWNLYGGSKAALEAETAVMAHDMAGTGVTANVLIPGGGTATRMTDDVGIPRDLLFPDTIMAAPIRYLSSDASDGFTAKRILACHWNAAVPDELASAAASDPIAWLGYGRGGKHPDVATQSSPQGEA
jgi:NAD(P)-dependent dehydrogenase (short-subunit alcohol dehydrogenase family)